MIDFNTVTNTELKDVIYNIQRPLMKVTYGSNTEQVFVVIAITWSHQYPGNINMIEAAEIYNREETSSSYIFEPDGNGIYRCGLMVGKLFYNY